jgi:UrcA family protein
MRQLVLPLCCGALAAGLLTAPAVPAFAQPTSEVTIIAPPVNKYESELSYRVSYRDLDLRKPEARKELDRRVSVTAEYLCKALKEPNVVACQHEAIAKSASAVAKAKHEGMTKTIKFVPGEPWIPPPGA